MEVECMASPAGATAIHQCLDLKELVSQNSAQGRPAMASTWRKCASFQCRGGACAKTADGRLASLVDAFSEELKARGVSVAAAAPIVTIRETVGAPAAITQAAAPGGAGTRTVFFSIYILFCLSVLLKWQLRGQYR
jgi:NAD-dependent oxidoreductase involved in siderophore biosynthesis